MADVAEVTQEQTQTQAPEGRQEFTVDTAPLLSGIFGVDQPLRQEPAATPVPAATTTTETTTTTTTPTTEQNSDEEILDPKDWLKRELEVDDIEILKAERAEYKKLKEQTPSEVKFENEQSKQIYELLKEGKSKEVKAFLETQEKLDGYLSTEVNEQTAADIIKLGMQLKYKDLTQSEINYKFNKEFGIPKEPVQLTDELDDEFEARKAEWTATVNDIKTNQIIEAKLLKPELENQKSKLVLPELSGQNLQKPPTQEELDAAKKYEEAYIQSVENSIKNFNGFSVAVKHEGVDLPVTFGVTDEEKSSLSGQLKEFAKSNYDANVLFASRWVGEDGALKPEQMIKDLSVLNNYEKAFQKFASDSSSKVLEAYLKGKKNIDVNALNQQGTATMGTDKTELDTVRDQFFG